MDSREAMTLLGPHPPFYFPTGANTLHAPPGLKPMLNPNLQNPLPNSGHPFTFGEQRHHQESSHGIQMNIASSPTMQQPVPSPPQPTEPVVKKKRGRPRKYVSDNQISLGLSPNPSSHKSRNSSSMSGPKGARGRPPGTGRKQRLANLGEWMNNSAGFAFAPHVISVEAGEDIVSKVLSFSQQRPRALCIMSGSGTVSAVTLRKPASSGPALSFQGSFEILSLGGSYLVNEEGGPKSRTGGISVSLSHSDGNLIGGGVEKLIAASLVQVVACSFVYGSAKTKAIKQENGSKEDKNINMETPPSSEPAAPLEEAVQTALNFSDPESLGSGGGNRSIDSRNHNHITDLDLTRG